MKNSVVACSLRAALPAIGAAVLFGCATAEEKYFLNTPSKANVYVAPIECSISKVAILPFKGPTELIGASVSELLVTEMLRAGRYELVERSQMNKVLSESELAMAGLSAAKAAEVGGMLGADGVIIGTVDDYSMVTYRGYEYPVVAVTVRLIDSQSGKVMWSADLAKRAEQRGRTLPEQAREVVHEVTAGLYRRWGVQRQVSRSSLPDQSSLASAEGLQADEPMMMAAVPDESESYGEQAPADEPMVSVPVEAAPAETSPPPEPPQAPADVVASGGLREVKLTWAEPAGDASKYRVERALSISGPFGEIGSVAPSDREYVDRGAEDAPLADNTPYYYRLTALGAEGLESKPADAAEAITAPPPEPPADVAVEAPAARTARVTWKAAESEGVERCLVERADASAPEAFQEVGEVAETEFSEGGTAEAELKDDAEYLYRVSAVNRVGAVGGPSVAVKVRMPPPPAKVSGVAAVSGEVRCVPVSWSPAAEADVVRYDVLRSDKADGDYVKIGSAEGRETATFLDGGSDPGNLEDEREYFYRVRSVNAVSSESEDSEPVAATTRGVPPAVGKLKAESGQPRQISLGWAVSPDEKVVAYEIERAQGEAEDFQPLARVEGRETVDYRDRGDATSAEGLGALPDGTEYTFRVAAINTAGARSPVSKTATATTKRVPAAPSEIVASTNLPKSVALEWKANAEPDVQTYVVESSTKEDGRFRELDRVGEPAYTDADEPDGARRFYRIRAIDADTLRSEWSAVVSGAAKPIPNAPQGLEAVWNGTGATITWEPPPQPDVKEYKVLKKGFLRSELLTTVSSPEVVLDAAQVGKKIAVVVCSVDGDGLESEASRPIEIRAPEVSK